MGCITLKGMCTKLFDSASDCLIGGRGGREGGRGGDLKRVWRSPKERELCKIKDFFFFEFLSKTNFCTAFQAFF